MRRLPIATDIAARCAVLSGLGFAAGFGWLWFPALQDWWLPVFLWGTLWSGGGVSLFLALLSTGFLGCAFLCRMYRETPDLRLTRLPHIAHGLTLVLLLIGLTPSLFTAFRLSGAWLFLPVACMALAGIIQGVFWAGAILALPERSAMAAYATAALASLLLGGLCSLTEGHMRIPLLFILIALAWWAALFLGRALRIPLPEPKRPRGRPPKINAGNGQDKPQAADRPSPAMLLAACAVLFCLLAVGQSLLATGAATGPSWLGGFPPLFGVAAVFLFVDAGSNEPPSVRENGATAAGIETFSKRVPPARLSPFTAVFCIMAAWGAALLFGSWNYMAWLAGGFLEGAACALALIALAGECRMDAARSFRLSGNAWERASFALAAALILAVVGETTGQGLSSLDAWLHNALADSPASTLFTRRMAGSISLALAGILLVVRQKILPPPDGGQDAITEARLAETEPALRENIPDPSFTEREMEILTLLRQGMSNRQVAVQLNIQEGTVRFHLRNIYQKTGVSEREELTARG